MRRAKKTTRNSKRNSTKPRKQMLTVNFEPLEPRQLLSTVNVGDFGAKPNDGGDDRVAIQRALDTAQPGDTVQFGTGVYEVHGGTLNVKTGRTVRGSAKMGTTLRFANSKTQFGFGIEPNAQNVTIAGLRMTGAGIQASYGSGYKNIQIIDNELTNIANKEAINAHAPSDGLVIEHNKFSNSDIWGYDITNATNLSISYNVFENIMQAGHLERPGDNVKLNYNLMTGLIRMGHEVQTQADDRTSLNGQVIGNVIYGWRDWYWDSFGLSIVARQKGWIIKDNYVRGDYSGQNKSKDPGGAERMGFGIEIGGYRAGLEGTPAINNIVGGNKFATFLTASLPNHVFTNNKFYGNAVWSNVGANPGTPRTTWTEVGTQHDRNFANMPAPPKIASVGPRDGTQASQPPQAENEAPAAPDGLSAKAAGLTQVNLSWSDNSGNEDGFRIEVSTDGKTWNHADNVSANTTSYSATGLTAGKNYSFRVRAYNSVGASKWSNVSSAKPTAPVVEGAKFTVTAIDPQTLRYNSLKLPSGTTQVRVESVSTVGRETGAQVGPNKMVDYTAGKSLDIKGYHPGWQIDVRIVAKNASGDILYTSEWVTVQMAGDPTAAWPKAQTPPTEQESPTDEPKDTAVYLGDKQWTSVRNGAGAVERNKSSGASRRGDGKTITLAGKTYSKGLGVHANSKIRYTLNGKYDQFLADIGVDDEVGNKGSVVFQVVADGKVLFDSGTMTGSSATKSVNVSVKGRDELWLVVTEAKDGTASDHADWANARLTPAVQAVNKSRKLLATVQPTDTSRGVDSLNLNASAGDEALRINKTRYSNGIGALSGSKLVYDLDGQYTAFTAEVGLDDEVYNKGSVVFQVWADGKKVYDSGIMTGKTLAKKISVNVSGKDQLWLVVTDAGDGRVGDHANWANARLAA